MPVDEVVAMAVMEEEATGTARATEPTTRVTEIGVMVGGINDNLRTHKIYCPFREISTNNFHLHQFHPHFQDWAKSRCTIAMKDRIRN